MGNVNAHDTKSNVPGALWYTVVTKVYQLIEVSCLWLGSHTTPEATWRTDAGTDLIDQVWKYIYFQQSNGGFFCPNVPGSP
jgi:hypothetical protein